MFLRDKDLEMVRAKVILSVRYVRNVLFNCLACIVTMNLLCGKHWELLRANEIFSGNVRKKYFV